MRPASEVMDGNVRLRERGPRSTHCRRVALETVASSNADTISPKPQLRWTGYRTSRTLPRRRTRTTPRTPRRYAPWPPGPSTHNRVMSPQSRYLSPIAEHRNPPNHVSSIGAPGFEPGTSCSQIYTRRMGFTARKRISSTRTARSAVLAVDACLDPQGQKSGKIGSNGGNSAPDHSTPRHVEFRTMTMRDRWVLKMCARATCYGYAARRRTTPSGRACLPHSATEISKATGTDTSVANRAGTGAQNEPSDTRKHAASTSDRRREGYPSTGARLHSGRQKAAQPRRRTEEQLGQLVPQAV